MSEIKTVGVVGAGTMGSGIAHVFARAGFNVMLCDVEMALLERAVERIRAGLGREAAKGRLTELEVESALERIKATVERDALAGVEFAIEAASERFEVKAEIFRAMDGMTAPDAVLATNTSSISIARLAAETGRPEKVIGAWDIVDTINGFAGVEILKPGVEGWLEGALRKRYVEEEPTTFNLRVGNMVARASLEIEALVRRHALKGWWVGIKVEPKIRILKRVR